MDSDAQLKEKAKELHIPLVWIGTKDQMPKHHRPGGYVINLQDDENSEGEQQDGTHWTALWIDENHHVAYSDSFGFPPPSDTQVFLTDYSPFPYTRKQIQNRHSGHCGEYALYFLYYMHNDKHHHNMKEKVGGYTAMWDRDTTKNLRLLENYMAAARKKESEKLVGQ